jgi:hypothetical protein
MTPCSVQGSPMMPQNDERDLVIDLGVLSAEPADEYHAKAGEYLSSHQLLDFMACARGCTARSGSA